MEEFSKNKQLRIQQYFKHLPITTNIKPVVISPQQFFENIDIDLYVSNKLMYFIREFFVVTTYFHYHTRKNYQENSIEKQFPFSHTGALDIIPIPNQLSIIIDSKTTTSP
jgi:hypothetical protein